ncbi:Conserved hypothetical protein [Candidatus Protochlamydia naegleriophila]|uniref:Uncharacterized protein n=1 Tax=Candidatus Protochlamydia naegleriophila TaxID=389348 RepID=A0A0U5J884_9BACT|nr:hypothetical protein [Candidatus Protochlamydia naegleriophila]CUI15992.1 Conserved hypothetical protein [Candidatus Protochlamydia naegleriophila]
MSDITSVGGSSNLQSFSYIQSPVFQSLPPAIQDSLIRSFTTDELNERFSGPTVGVPTLLSPSITSGSINEFFKILNDAKVELNQQFRTSDFIDQVTRKKDSRAAGLQALGLVDQFSIRAAAIIESQKEAMQKTTQLQTQTTTMKNLVDAQNNRINDMNNQNSQDRSNFQSFRNAYNAYVQALQDNGITKNGDNFTVPKGKEGIYNALTEGYRNSVNWINDYWAARGTAINNYNNATNSYNQTVQPNNNWVTNFIKDNDLQSYLDKYSITVSKQQNANQVNNSGLSSRQSAPGYVSGEGPVTVNVPPPNSFAVDMANGAYNRSVSNIATITVFETQSVGTVIDDKMYEKNVSPIDSVISFNVEYWGFLRILSIFNPNVDYTPDPLLNFKPLSRKVIPNTIIDIAQPIASNNTQGAGTLAIQSIGLDNPHITAILGQAALAQSIRNLNLNLTEDQIAEVANQVLVLSLGLIGRNSLDALLPSLAPVLSVLSSLPPDSPALSLLFALSFANRVQELAGQGLTTDALQTFLNGIPALQNLSPADLEALTATINLGLLLVSTKLLESSLGLPGLSAQLLLPLLPPELAAAILGQASATSQLNNTDLQAQLQANFIAQGFSQDEAAFLADLGVSLVNQNLLTPSSTSIAQDSINQQLLVDSIKASLILSDSRAFDLARADAIAREVVSRTFEDLGNQSTSVTQFRADLQSNLQDLNVRSVVADEVLRDIILTSAQNSSLQPPELTNNANVVPPPSNVNVAPSPNPTIPQQPSQSIPQQPSQSNVNRPSQPVNTDTRSADPVNTDTRSADNVTIPTSTTSTTRTNTSTPQTNNNGQPVDDTTPSVPPAPFTPLTQAQLVAILERRAAELLVPQLGTQLAKQITEEIAQTLFGTPNPDPRDEAQLKSPLSLVNTVSNQIYHLKLDQNEEYAEATTEAFKETIVTSKDFYAFSLKVMDPAYSLIYSAGTGIMYAGHEPSNWKKSIDIIV